MKNFLQNTQFISSAVHANDFVPDSGYEVCFIGRSNAGKSSAINTLCDNQKLVKTSKTPGRTQAVNFFAVRDEKRLVDLPGYGFANISAKTRQRWDQLLSTYFTQRESLRCVFIVVDIRRGLSDMDKDAIVWLRGLQVELAIHILLTKSDKLNRSQITTTADQTEATIASQYDSAIQTQVFSATKGVGVEQTRAAIRNYLKIS